MTRCHIIQRIVASNFNLEPERLRKKSRRAPIVLARHIAMYLCWKHTSQSLQQIAESFNRVNHTTVIHARDKIKRELRTIPEMRTTVAKLEGELPDFWWIAKTKEIVDLLQAHCERDPEIIATPDLCGSILH